MMFIIREYDMNGILGHDSALQGYAGLETALANEEFCYVSETTTFDAYS